MTLETAANRAAGQNKSTAAYGQELDGGRHEPVREDDPEPVRQLQVSDSCGDDSLVTSEPTEPPTPPLRGPAPGAGDPRTPPTNRSSGSDSSISFASR